MNRSRSIVHLLTLLAILISFLGGSIFTTPAHAAVTVFGAGSFIIPMDTGTNGQNNGMLRAYGLVYELLRQGVPVHWVVDPGKAAFGDDFSISAGSVTSVRTAAAVALPRSYRGGPFIIDVADAAEALPIIQAWQAVPGDQTAVHLLVSGSISPDVYRTLVRAPRIGILKDGNETIAFNNLNAAGIPDSSGNSWSAASPDLLTESMIAGATTSSHTDGVLFDPNSGLGRYCFLASMHYITTATTSEVVAETRAWLDASDLHAAYMQCESASVFENDVNGLFLTNAGLADDGAAPASSTIRVPSNGLAQLDGTFQADSGTVDSMKANSASPLADYKTGVTTIINESSAVLTDRINLLTGRLDGDNANGRVTYLGGHDYSLALPITSNPQTNGVRIFLNAIFMADCAVNAGQADVSLTMSAPSTIYNNTIQYTIDYSNPGPRPTESVRITDVLPAGATYVNGSASITPTSTSGGVLTWDLPVLDSGESGSLTFDVTVTVNGDYNNVATMNFSHLAVRTIESNTATTTRDVQLQNGVLDDFNRANGTVGANWSVATALVRHRIVGGQLDIQMGGALVWRSAIFGVDQEAFVTLASVDPSGVAQGVMLKTQGGFVPNSGAILVAYDARTQVVRVTVWRSGVRTNYSPIAATFANGDQLGAQILADGTLTIYQNGAPIASISLTAADQAFFNSRSGRIGIWTQKAPNAVLDDFGGGTVTP